MPAKDLCEWQQAITHPETGTGRREAVVTDFNLALATVAEMPERCKKADERTKIVIAVGRVNIK